MSRIDDLKAIARGRWRDEILPAMTGLTPKQLTKKHQPCPVCGGTDRYRFDDKRQDAGDGGWYCNVCPGQGGDGLDLVAALNRWELAKAAREVAAFLGCPDEWQGSAAAEQARQEWKARDAAIREREEADRRRYAEEASRYFYAATPTTEVDPATLAASYWGKKGLRPSQSVRIDADGNVVVPVVSNYRGIVCCQTISPDGRKLNYPKGASLKGGVFYFGELTRDAKAIAIAEGPATAASIYEATGWPTVCSFGTPNLEAAVDWVRALVDQGGCPLARIFVCADNDAPGLAAIERLRGRGLTLVTPPEPGDFDDLRRNHGPDAVLAVLEAAEPDDSNSAREAETMTAAAIADRPVVAEPVPAAVEAPEATAEAPAGKRQMSPEQAALWASLAALNDNEDLADRRYQLAALARQYGMSIPWLMQIMDDLLDPEAAAARNRAIFEVMPDDELFSDDDEDDLLTQYVIPGLVPVGEAALLAGEAKAGKSQLAYEAIRAVLKGDRFLGEYCRQGKVLLLQLEENHTLRRRLAAKGISAKDNRGRFRVIRNFDAANLKALDQFRKELAAFKPDLVVLDSIRGAMAYSDESENHASFARPIKRVIKACQDVNAALVAIHHTNKSKEATGLDKIAGTKALLGEFWGVMQLERSSDREDDPFRILSVVPRDAARVRLSIEYQPPEEGRAFAWRNHGVLAGDDTSQNLRDRILAALQTHGDMRTGLIAERLPDEGGDTVRRALYRLRDLGLVTSRQGEASGTGRPPTIWTLNPDHFKGITVATNNNQPKTVFSIENQQAIDSSQSLEGTPPLSPPVISDVPCHKTPPEEADLLGRVTKASQNPEAPEAASGKESRGFVTMGHDFNGGRERGGSEPDPTQPPEGEVLDCPDEGEGEAGDRPLAVEEAASFRPGTEWIDPSAKRSKSGRLAFLRVWTADGSGVVLARHEVASNGNPVLEQGIRLTPSLAARLVARDASSGVL